MNKFDAGFGPVLKALRAQLSLSQSQLADALSSTQRHISFLETGRSSPTRAMLARMCIELDLSSAQRSALFEASGFQNPYKTRAITSQEIVETLDMLEARVLTHWPFPAFVLADDWTVLRQNAAALRMFSMFGVKDAPINLLALFLSETFSQMVRNWPDASTSLYFRMLKHAQNNADIARELEEAKRRGLFDHVSGQISDRRQVPVYEPIELGLPNGAIVRVSSVLGHLASVHDALVEGLDIEFMIPVDAESEALMLAMQRS